MAGTTLYSVACSDSRCSGFCKEASWYACSPGSRAAHCRKHLSPAKGVALLLRYGGVRVGDCHRSLLFAEYIRRRAALYTMTASTASTDSNPLQDSQQMEISRAALYLSPKPQQPSPHMRTPYTPLLRRRPRIGEHTPTRERWLAARRRPAAHPLSPSAMGAAGNVRPVATVDIARGVSLLDGAEVCAPRRDARADGGDRDRCDERGVVTGALGL